MINISDRISGLLKTYPELLSLKNKNRVIRIIWGEDDSIDAETILRTLRRLRNT